jgi:hypothetical protein
MATALFFSIAGGSERLTEANVSFLSIAMATVFSFSIARGSERFPEWLQ